MSATKPPNEADIIFNRANIALARSQRLVASWLPPRTTSEESQKSGENRKGDDDDDEIFTAVPERLGLGAPIPVKDAFNSLNSSNTNKLDDKLRQRLLGRNAKKFMQQQQQQKQQAALSRGKTGQGGDNKNGNKDVEDDADADEDEGRTSLGKKKQQKHILRSESEDNGIVTDSPADVDETNINGDNTTGTQTQTLIPTIPTLSAPNKRKKTTKVSYLDELLQDRKKKKKKRND